MKKTWNFFKNFIIIAYILLIIFVTICLLSYNDYKVTEFGKYTLLPVIDDYLEPDYKVGDLLLIEKNDVNDVNLGDVIFYYRTSRGITTVNYSPVIELERVTDTETTFTAVGDVRFSSSYFMGKADTITVIPHLGKVLGLLQSKWGFLFLGVFPSLLAFLYTLYSVVYEVKTEKAYEEEQKKKKKKKKVTDEELTENSSNSEDKPKKKKKKKVVEEDDEEVDEKPKKKKKKVEEKPVEEKPVEEIDEEDNEEEDEETEKVEEKKAEVKEEKEEIKEEKVEIKEVKAEEKKEVVKEEPKVQKQLTEEQKKALIEAKMKTMTEEQKKALIEAKLKSMTPEQKKALLEAKKKKLMEENGKK